MTRRTRRNLRYVSYGLIWLTIIVYAIFPFYWAVVSSLETGSALFTVDFIPKDPAWENYTTIFREQPFARNILNSVFVSVLTVAVSLILALLAAYALGRVRFAGRGLILFTILSVSMFPQVAVLSGMFELIRGLGLYNSVFGLSLSYLIFTLPFTVWVLTTFVKQLPVELEEAAIIDGARPFTILRRVMIPLLVPALVTTGLLAFIHAWNEFLFALTFTLSNDARTVPVAIALISGSSEYELPWGPIMAASVVVTVPLIVLVLVFQKRIVAGLTAGAVKG